MLSEISYTYEILFEFTIFIAFAHIGFSRQNLGKCALTKFLANI